MNGLTGVLFAGLVMSGAAQAEEWQTYTYPNPGFAIQFPAVPDVQTTRLKNAAGVTVPTTRYVVRQEGVEYTLSVANYSSTNADALGTIGAAARSLTAKGQVNSNTGARINASYGRELTVTESDGSRSDIAIFFIDNYLYTVVGRASPPNPMGRAADTARFQQSLQFPGDDGSFRGWSGGNTPTVNTPAKTHTTENTQQRADDACAGKSAGDVVQLQTPAGLVRATCTLTARPNP